MRASTLKTFAAIAFSTASCVSFAQAVSESPSPPAEAAPDAPSYGYVTPSYPSTMNRSCAGLSDRQTERACKQGFTTQHSDMPNALSSDHGGPTDDQAG
jgi:hypothetical protein